ncbi:MAG: anti-sigma factor family protein, partial [Pyrinomonadaceae bacterium]
MSENILNSTCNNGEQIVSFLYGELAQNEKNNFERHLQSCESCAVELGEFSNVHFSIREWRDQDFQKLSTPNFKIPSNLSKIAGGISWIESVRGFFTLRTAGFSAAAAGIVLTFFSLFWFFNNSANDNEIASNRLENSSGNVFALKNRESLIGKKIETFSGKDEVKEEISDKTGGVSMNSPQREDASAKLPVPKNAIREKSVKSHKTGNYSK